MEHVVSEVSIVAKDMKYTYHPRSMGLATALQFLGSNQAKPWKWEWET